MVSVVGEKSQLIKETVGSTTVLDYPTNIC